MITRSLRTIVLTLGILAFLMCGFLLFAQSAGVHIPVSPAKGAQAHAQYPLAPTSTPVCGLAWRLASSPNVTGTNNTLAGIAAVSENDIWAVGSTGSIGARGTLIEHWNGTQWSVVAGPNVGSGDNHLHAVTAVSARDVWAVGNADNQTLILHWDGAQWKVVPSPSPWQAGNFLNAVAASASNDVWAAGYYSDGVLYQTMVEHWDGVMWSVVPTLSIKTANNVFLGVETLSASDAWAVGLYSMEGVLRTLIEHWDGVAWTIMPSPNVGSWSAVVSLAAVTPSDVWTVGAYSDNTPLQILIEHWDGAQWEVVPSANIGLITTVLSSVSAVSASDVWAVGESLETDQPIIERWNGREWSLVPSPQEGTMNNLNGVAAISSGDVWAVGDYTNADLQAQTLALHYSEPCLPTTSTPTPPATITSTPPATVTNTPTNAPTNTRVLTMTGTATPTLTYTPILSTTPIATPTLCSISYSDVLPSDYFYSAVLSLSCRGVISGYADATFRPYSNATRGQLTKIVVLAEGWPIDANGGPHFSDVPAPNPFYSFIETAYNRSVIAGYSDGTFRWSNSITRGQLCKIMALAERWLIDVSGGPHFADVPVDYPFYQFVETAYNRNVISGYGDGTFRPGSNATRGQVCKILYSAIVPR